MRKVSARQKAVLNLLLDKYEGSRTYKGENHVHQSFVITPSQVYPNYEDNFEPMAGVQLFEEEMRELEEQRLVLLSWKSNAIVKIGAAAESLPEYYRILHRKPLADEIASQREFFQRWLGHGELTDRFCLAQLNRLSNGRKVQYPPETAEPILNLLVRIGSNREDILERELSIAVLGDSKLFGQKYRTRVCRIMEEYGDYRALLADIDDKREREIVLLEEHQVYMNPSYIYIKGNGTICFAGNKNITLRADLPMALPTQTLQQVEEFRVEADAIMTIENLTSFNRLQKENCFLIYLSGYHNTLKQRMIQKLAEDNPQVKWLHFGDIDPDGFLILENLKRGTGIRFKPYAMGIPELKEYRNYTKPLQKNDIAKAENLAGAGLYRDTVLYMLQHNCKLEQEIISWMG